MTETPGYESSGLTRRRVALGVGLLVVLALGASAFAFWTLDVTPAVLNQPPLGEGVTPNETVNVSVRDAPADFDSASGERVFVVHHQGGTRVFYQNLRVVIYDGGVPILSLTAPEWATGSLALSENGAPPENASAFASGDRLAIYEPPHENAAILDDGDVYVVMVVDAESGRILGGDTVVLD